MRGFFWLILFSFAVHFAPAAAHQTGESYIYVDVGEDEMSGRYEIPLQELGLIFDIDSDGDDEISSAEYEAAQGDIERHFEDRIRFDIAGTVAPIKFTAHTFYKGTAVWVLMEFDVLWTGGAIPDAIDILHRGSWDVADPNHRILVVIGSNARTGVTDNEAQVSLILGGGDVRDTLDLTPASKFAAFWLFIWHGIHHLVIGYDHIAFIIALVLPAVLVLRAGKWEPVEGFGAALISLIKIATVFTIAHSVTLVLAALELVRVPPNPVEAVIALSIAGAAAANIFAVPRKWAYTTVFLLGLVHGLGFANVLQPLAMEPVNLVPSLLGFNIGVEIGQIAIVIVPFALLYLLRRWSGYQMVILKGGSAMLIVYALYLFVMRVGGAVLRLIS